MEQGGEWFFFNVEQAFEALLKADAEGAEQAPIHGDAKLADEAEARAAASGIGQRQALDKVEF